MIAFLGVLGSIIGLIVSFYIYTQKKNKTSLICPREVHCDRVTGSTYATTVGIPNELLGIGYYSIAGVLHALVFAWPIFLTPLIAWFLTILTAGALLFSLYFIILQALVIRAWCLWCLGSAFATMLLVGALVGQGIYPLLILLGIS
jgi:uncharacterized membrane protein